MEDTVIALSRLTKRYGEFTAVSGLDLTIRRGKSSACSVRTAREKRRRSS